MQQNPKPDQEPQKNTHPKTEISGKCSDLFHYSIGLLFSCRVQMNPVTLKNITHLEERKGSDSDLTVAIWGFQSFWDSSGRSKD